MDPAHTTSRSTHRSTHRGARRNVTRSACPTAPRQSNGTRSRSRFTLLEGMIVLACAAALVLTFARALTVPAPGNVSSLPVRVEASQTLWDLAAAHPIDGLTTGQTVDFIQQLNGMPDSSLKAGEVVLVPCTTDRSTALASR